MKLDKITAIVRKEMMLNLRFKSTFFGRAFLDPLRFLLLFIIVYSSFFSIGTNSMAGVAAKKFLPFLIIGGIAHSLYIAGLGFDVKFKIEKYWETLPGILIAPVSPIILIIGTGIAELLREIPFLFIYIVVGYCLAPIKFFDIFFISMIFLLLYIGILGLGLIKGVFEISKEGLGLILDYVFAAIGLLSCFYYHISVLPTIIKPLVLINPIYHAVSLIRAIWMNEFSLPSALPYLISIILFAIIMPIIGCAVFKAILKKFSIQGY